jgi:hypothetical protein
MPAGMTGALIADRYRVQRRLGAGGMATVFLAEDCRLERDVALKWLHADSPEDVGRRFQREAKVGASLNHPNIVSVYDTVTDDESVLIVMEYVPGHTLRDEIARGPMAPARAIEVLRAVASALDHAHEHGVVHRDVKPANVLIDDRAGQVKLADLGIATAAEHSRITRSGAVLGTAAYMAPERLDGGAGERAVDIYALAAVAFEALSGRKAVEGCSPLEIARRIATALPPDLRDFVPGAPAGAAEALKRGLAKRPEERQASAGELVRELSSAYAEQAGGERSGRATAVVAEPRRRERTSTGNGHGNGRLAVAGAAAEPAREPAHRPHAAGPFRSGSTGRARRRWVIPAALALAALVVVAALAAVLSSGGGSSEKSRSGGQASKRAEKSSRAKSQGGGSRTPAAPGPATGGGSAGADLSTPQSAVSSFYRSSIDDPQGAYRKMGSDNLHNQLSEADFAAQESTLVSIDFPQLEVTDQTPSSATVRFRSIARHTTKTDRCSGTIDVVKGSSGWLVDQLHVAGCTHGPPS